jgi:polysaccharide biosynthesis/export protein
MRTSANCRTMELLVLLAMMAVAWPARSQERTAPVFASASPASDASNADTRNSGARNAATPNPVSAPDSYVIGTDDQLNVHVWHQTEISGPVTVRPDGKISLPLIGEVAASGLTPPELQASIAERLRAFVNEPDVTVIVQQANSKKFNVMGRVEHPGSFSLATRTRVLDGIAAAGGFSDFARVANVYVLRTTGAGRVQKLPFNYKRITRGHDESQNIELQPGDTVVVP